MRRCPYACRRAAWSAAVAGLALALGACVAVQVPKLPTSDLPAHWRNAAALGARPDLTGWWRQFNDPRLDALVARALADNPGVAQATWNLRAARALEAGAGSAFKPAFTFRTDEQSNTANTASYFQAGFDATWEIPLFGRAGAGGRVAAANAGAAEAELQSARVSLVAEVVREYLQLRAAQHQEAVLAGAAHAARRKLALVRGQERLQLATRIEVEAASTGAEEAAGRVADPRVAVARSAQSLAVLLGRSEPDPAWLAPTAQPRLALTDVAPLPADLLRTRPEIRYAETQVLHAAGELGIATADLYPRLALGGGLSASAQVIGHTDLGKFHTIGGLGPFITIPLFHGHELRAQRDARADQLQAALSGYRKAVLAGAAQVETSLATLQAARSRVTHADAAVASSERGLGLTRKLQGRGEADRLNVVAAELALSQVQLAQVDARLQRGLAFVGLYKALGGAPLPQSDIAARGAAAITAGDPGP